jgi:hypothetical protein
MASYGGMAVMEAEEAGPEAELTMLSSCQTDTYRSEIKRQDSRIFSSILFVLFYIM